MKTNELTGAALDWAVAKCEGREWESADSFLAYHEDGDMNYSTDWAQGGPIIEREKITIVCAEGDYNPSKAGTPDCYDTYWVAEKGRLSAGTSYGPQGDDWGERFHIDVDCVIGPTPLIAAMRCYVVSKLGNEVEIPKELVGGNIHEVP